MPQHEDELFPQTGLSREEQWAEYYERTAAEAAPEEDPEDPPKEEPVGLLGRSPNAPLLRATFRGVGRAVNEISNTAFSLGKEIIRRTGLYKASRDDVGEQEWLDWYDQRSKEINPLQFDVRENSGGWSGFYEGAVQFGVGFVAAGTVFKAAGLTNTAFRGAAALRGGLAGGVSDFASFDPWEERLSDLVQQHSPLRDPVTAFLAADEEDSELLGRIKNTLEGAFLGGTIEAIGLGFRALRVHRAARAGKIPKDEAADQIEEIVSEAADIKTDEPFKIEVNDDGSASITSTEQVRAELGEDLGDLEIPERMDSPGPAEAEHIAAALNKSVRERVNSRKPHKPVEMTDEIRGEMARAARAFEGGDPTDPRLLEGINLNLFHVDNTRAAREMINGLATVLSEEFVKRQKNTRDPLKGFFSNYKPGSSQQNWEMSTRLAKGILDNVEPDELVGHLAKLSDDTQNLPAIVQAARILMHSQAKAAADASRALEYDPTNPLLVRLWSSAADRLANTATVVGGVQSDIARTLNIMGSPITGDLARSLDLPDQGLGKVGRPRARDPLKEIEGTIRKDATPPKPKTPRPEDPFKDVLTPNPITEFITKARLTPRELRALARSVRLAGGDSEATLRALRLTVKEKAQERLKDPSLWDRVLSFRASMMLSGPRTMAVNAVSSAMASAQVPLELALGGAMSGNKEITRMGLDMLGAWKPWAEGGMYLGNAWRAAWQSFKTLDGQLDPTLFRDETGFAKLQHDTMGTFSKALSLPSRILLGTDEFVKQMAYGGHLRAQTLGSLREQTRQFGRKFSPQEISERIYDDLMASFDSDGAALNPNGLEHARVVTFTNRLEYGFGQQLLETGNKVPAFRLIMPFIRTPVNLFRFAWQRFPGLGFAQKQLREDLMAGGTRRASALGRQAMGTMAFSLAGYMAFTGKITGSGPDNQNLRSQLLNSGWQPYSIRVGNRWVSYRRLEPIATPIGIVADYVEALGEIKDDATAEEALTAMLAGMASSVSSKTFLIGMSDFFDAVSSGRASAVKKFASSFVTSFLPAAARQADPDPVWRDVNNILQEIRADIPGVSAGLEPRRNIFGEPVQKPPGYFNRSFNPFTVISDKDIDDVLLELAELGKAMPMPSTQEGKLDLKDRGRWVNTDPDRKGQSPYDRMLEIAGSSDIGGRTMRDQVASRMRSDGYQKLSAGTETYPGGRRFMVIQEIIQKRMDIAKKRMLREYPDLREAIRGQDRERIESLFNPQP
jgi:hypothetical protein